MHAQQHEASERVEEQSRGRLLVNVGIRRLLQQKKHRVKQVTSRERSRGERIPDGLVSLPGLRGYQLGGRRRSTAQMGPSECIPARAWRSAHQRW